MYILLWITIEIIKCLKIFFISLPTIIKNSTLKGSLSVKAGVSVNSVCIKPYGYGVVNSK